MSKKELEELRKNDCSCGVSSLKNPNSNEIHKYKDKLDNIYSEFEKYSPDNFSKNWRKLLTFTNEKTKGTFNLFFILVIIFVICFFVEENYYSHLGLNKSIFFIVFGIILLILLFIIKSYNYDNNIGDIVRLIDILECHDLYNATDLSKLSLASIDIIEKQNFLNRSFNVLTLDNFISLFVLVISIVLPFYIQELSDNKIGRFLVYSFLVSVMLMFLLIIKNVVISFNTNSKRNKKYQFYRYIIEIQDRFYRIGNKSDKTECRDEYTENQDNETNLYANKYQIRAQRIDKTENKGKQIKVRSQIFGAIAGLIIMGVGESIRRKNDNDI